jgi:pyruvate/2-oxoglutarate dehydrogenase complex dihydrolipoamide dehydrogenase (E3) component
MKYDLIVIGGGSAGLTAAIIAGHVGAKVLLVDKERFGGDCTYYGCVPSKALIHCANTAHAARTSARFGVEPASGAVDFAKVMAYVWSIIDDIASHETSAALAEHGVDTALGGAAFLSPKRLIIGGEREVSAEQVVIAVGSHAVAPPIPGLEEAGYINHVSVFHLEELPRRLAVIGGGPIGVELGQALARLGSEVTIVQRAARILARDDEDLTTMLGELLADELTLVCCADVDAVEQRGDSKVVRYQRDGQAGEVECDEILVAVGRKASFAGLDLEAAGVACAHGLIKVDATMRTSVANIWAAGDCATPLQFTHVAEAQARIATRNALFRGSKRFSDAVVPRVTFSDPELAAVGLSEAEARAQHGDIKVYRYPYERLDRAMCEGAGHGLAKIVCTSRGKILGAAFLGPIAGEAISNLVLAMNAGTSIGDLAGTIFAYPTMNRIVRRVADERFLSEGLGTVTRKLFARF